MKDLGIEEDWLALPGIPAGSGVWEKLPIRTLDFQGVQDASHRPSWALQSFVDETLPHYDHETILIGHDLGGVIAAMSAVHQPPKAILLTGTALGHWWFWTRLSAAPILNRFFYHTFKGSLFVRLGGGHKTGQRFANQPHFHDPSKMKKLARHMKPPTNLVEQLKLTCPVYIIWGRKEIFYPGFLAQSLSSRLDAPMYWNDGGHYCMWTHAEEFLQSMQQIESLNSQDSP